MSSYRPGQGVSSEALERLRARKQAEAAIKDVPAEDQNAQWDKLLGISNKKKLRCGTCTRPLSEEEQRQKRLTCIACDYSGLPNWVMDARSAREKQELGVPALYYALRTTAAPRSLAKQPALPTPEELTHAFESPSSRAEPAPTADGADAVLQRGAPARWTGTVPPTRTAFSVLSLNVLPDCSAMGTGKAAADVSHCDAALLAWEGRCQRMCELLRSTDADIVCLQDVELEKRGADWAKPAWLEALPYEALLLEAKQQELERLAERNSHCLGVRAPTTLATLFKKERFEARAVLKAGAPGVLAAQLRCLEKPADGDAIEVAVCNILTSSKGADQTKALNAAKKAMGKQDLRVVCLGVGHDGEPGTEVQTWSAKEGYREAVGGASWAAPGASRQLDHLLHAGDLRLLCASGPLSAEEQASGLPCASAPWSSHLPRVAVLTGAAKGRCPW